VADSLLTDLSEVLDLVVLEQLPGGFVQITAGPLPSWFVRAFRAADVGGHVTLLEALPALDAFLAEAETFWKGATDGRLASEPFFVTDAPSHEIPVAATAVTFNGRRILLLEPDRGYEDRQRLLQRAREQARAHEQVVRRIEDLHRPLAELSRLSDQLSKGALSDDQRATLADVTAQVNALRRVVDDLPRPPRGEKR
jgi:hypothetical protein